MKNPAFAGFFVFIFFVLLSLTGEKVTKESGIFYSFVGDILSEHCGYVIPTSKGIRFFRTFSHARKVPKEREFS